MKSKNSEVQADQKSLNQEQATGGRLFETMDQKS